METIPFWVASSDATIDPRQGEKGFFRSEAVLQDISIDCLRENLSRVSQSILGVLADIRKVGEFRLKEVEFQVEVTAEGGVEFIGTAKVGGKGAVTLKFGE